ncbi:DUF7523 family protein [Haloglomus salinum]|uniref:DUF7523 family protein n=1 Tax=Haloglomus salinum TaxID=2962673 RepID=UPI0020C9A5FE|nr:hypothetical protein [Haloglomus salinum]
MTLAADTREAVRERPFLHAALQAGVVNYTAAARFLDLGDTDEDHEAVAAALRRYADELGEYEPTTAGTSARVEMRSGIGPTDDRADAVLSVGGVILAPTGGDDTGIVATGDLDPTGLAEVLDRLRLADIDVNAAGATDESAVVVVPRRDGPTALRVVEETL